MYLVDEDGDIVAQYTYDPYGKVTNVVNANNQSITSPSHIGNLNPLRYRGYCYDNETGLYYLISRYYDPITGRFINADDVAYLGITGEVTSYNLYSYCENSPISYNDPLGRYKIKYFNCYAYAMGYSDRWLHPGKGNKNVRAENGSLLSSTYAMQLKYTVDQVAKWVLQDFGRNAVRILEGQKSKIYTNRGEYLVAVRVWETSKKTYDFHFWKKDPKTEIWWDKPGQGKIRKLGKINPDTSKQWGNYNSKTVYLAIRKTFWSK